MPEKHRELYDSMPICRSFISSRNPWSLYEKYGIRGEDGEKSLTFLIHFTSTASVDATVVLHSAAYS